MAPVGRNARGRCTCRLSEYKERREKNTGVIRNECKENKRVSPCWLKSQEKLSKAALASSLTDTAETLLAKADEHIEAEIAVGRSIKVLQAPDVIPVVLNVLLGKGKTERERIEINMGSKGKGNCRLHTESKPRRTSRGMVVRPPRFHSSRLTVPSAS